MRLGDICVITLTAEPMGFKARVECKAPPLEGAVYYGFSERGGLVAIEKAFKHISAEAAEKLVMAEVARIQEESKL